MTQLCIDTYSEARLAMLVDKMPALRIDRYCTREARHWVPQSAARCDLCINLDRMGTVSPDGNVHSEVPDYRHRSFRVTYHPHTKDDLTKILAVYKLQAANPIQEGFIHWASVCGTDLAVLHEPPRYESLDAASKAGVSMAVLAEDLVRQWDQLSAIKWSNPTVVAEGLVAGNDHVGWQRPWAGTFESAPEPASWISTVVTFSTFVHNSGYPSYTPMVAMLHIAQLDTDVTTTKAWKRVFGLAAEDVTNRLVLQKKKLDVKTISELLEGISLARYQQ